MSDFNQIRDEGMGNEQKVETTASQSSAVSVGGTSLYELQRSLALLIRDAVELTEGPLNEDQKKALRYGLSFFISSEEWFSRFGHIAEELTFDRLLDAGFEVTATYDPERWQPTQTASATALASEKSPS